MSACEILVFGDTFCRVCYDGRVARREPEP